MIHLSVSLSLCPSLCLSLSVSLSLSLSLSLSVSLSLSLSLSVSLSVYVSVSVPLSISLSLLPFCILLIFSSPNLLLQRLEGKQGYGTIRTADLPVIVIVNSRFLQRPQKRSRRNQLIHRRLSKTKSTGR